MATASLAPLYPGKVRRQSGLLSTANTVRDGSSGTLLDLFIADTTHGSIVERIGAWSAGAISVATSANVIRMYVKLSSTYRLIAEYAIVATTPTAAVVGGLLPGASSASPFLTVNIKLAAGETLSFSIHTVAGTQDNYHVSAEGGDYSVS